MAKTDKPQATTTIPFPGRPRRNKSKQSLHRQMEEAEDLPSPKRSKKNPSRSNHVNEPNMQAIAPCHTITERIVSNQLTVDIPIYDREEETIVNSIEYQNLVNWLVEKCKFAFSDAKTFAFSLIAHHRVFNIQMLYDLFIRDRNYLSQMLPIGYLITLEQQLFTQFFKKLETLSEQELFILLINNGFSKATIERLIYTYEVCGALLNSISNLEQELLNLGLVPIVVKALVAKVQQVKICGVPMVELKDSNQEDEAAVPHDHQLHRQSPLAQNKVIFTTSEQAHSVPAEAMVEVSSNSLDDCLDTIARTYSEIEQQEGRNADELSETKLFELFDFEIMSNFDQELSFSDANPFLSDNEMDQTDSCIGSSPSYRTSEKSASPSKATSSSEDISPCLSTGRAVRPTNKYLESKRLSPQKPQITPICGEEISRNSSFLKIPALLGPSLEFFESMLRRCKKGVIDDLVAHRVVIELIQVASCKTHDLKLRRRAFLLINGSIRRTNNQQLIKAVPMDAFLSLVHSCLKVDDSSLVHQSLIFIETIFAREPPFLPSALCVVLKILNARKERILRYKQVLSLAKIVEVAIKIYQLDLGVLIEYIELINFLLLSGDPSTQYSLLQSCTMILEDGDEHLVRYLLSQFSWKRFSTLLSSKVNVVKTEAMVICETITCERLEPVKILLQECPGLLSTVKEHLLRESDDCEPESIQSLAFGFVGNICSGDVEDIQKLIDEDIYTIICGYFLSDNTKPYEKSEIDLRRGKNRGKSTRSNKRKRNYKNLEIRGKIHLQCAFAVCYTLFGASEEQILYFINKHQLFTILLGIISNYSNTLDLMEEFLPGLSRVLTMDIKDPKQVSDFLYLLRNNYFIELLAVQEAFAEENMDTNIIEEVLAIIRGN